MSKVKNAELEERALIVADTLLTIIEAEVELFDKQKKAADPDKLKKLINSYQALKPYF